MRPQLYIFAKAPAMGKAKTRLATDIGKVHAHRLYRTMLDCPQVTRNDIADGFEALKKYKAVFGPADDGGFWLMGMRGPVSAKVFEDVRWSHKDTLSDIERNIGGQVHHLRTLIDVDDLKALQALRSLKSRQL